MNTLVAFDSFKDALPAEKVCKSIERGFLFSFPNSKITLMPLADGGEGTLNALKSSLKGEFVKCNVYDPLFRNIKAKYLISEDYETAYIEMAQASGLELLNFEERNPMQTSSFGTGELILDAMDKGVKKIILFVGGSATNDAGVGMAAALGFGFINNQGDFIDPIGENLEKVVKLDISETAYLKNIEFIVATDVTNPFYGEHGAAYVFGPQKGANTEQVKILDEGLQNISELFKKEYNIDLQNLPGGGAAGGMSGAAHVLLKAKIVSAADLIMDICKIEDVLKKSDLLITGEGRIDSQTWDGKLISQLNKLALKHNVKTIILGGAMEYSEKLYEQENVIYASTILNKPMDLEDAIANTEQLLYEKGKMLGRFLNSYNN